MRRLSLGRTTDISLEQALERANALTSAARAGRDLIVEEESHQRLFRTAPRWRCAAPGSGFNAVARPCKSVRGSSLTFGRARFVLVKP